jgi:hypothetical protein
MSEGDTEHDRFYLCDNGDSEDAFLVCGRCLENGDNNRSLYVELKPLDESIIERGHTRVCIACDRDAAEVRSLHTDNERSKRGDGQ